MYVKVHNEYPRYSKVLHSVSCRHGHIVAQAKATNIILHSVMPRGSDKSNAICQFSLHNSSGEIECCGSCQSRRIKRVLIHKHRFGQCCTLDLFHRFVAHCLQEIQVLFRVHKENLLVSCTPRRNPFAPGCQSKFLTPLMRHYKSLGRLDVVRVPWASMLLHVRVINIARHCSFCLPFHVKCDQRQRGTGKEIILY
jgi:hypothetical protein